MTSHGARLIILEKLATDSGFDRRPSEESIVFEGRTLTRLRFSSTQSDAIAVASPIEAGYLLGLEAPSSGGESWSAALQLPCGRELRAAPDALHTRWIEISGDAELCVLLGWWWGLHSRFEPLSARVARATRALPRVTEIERSVATRIGQDVFRAALFDYWGGRCALTGISLAPLLRASHIKRWADATDAERLDVHNGLLLAAQFDALFDRGLISFEDNGSLVLSNAACAHWHHLSIAPPEAMRIAGVMQPHAAYLAFHREHYFEPVARGT
jgi:hypothetical protein